MLKVTVPEETNVYQDDQICAVLKTGIDWDVHGVQAIWDSKSSTETWGFTLVDTKNAFNEIN